MFFMVWIPVLINTKSTVKLKARHNGYLIWNEQVFRLYFETRCVRIQTIVKIPRYEFSWHLVLLFWSDDINKNKLQITVPIYTFKSQIEDMYQIANTLPSIVSFAELDFCFSVPAIFIFLWCTDDYPKK